MWIQDIFFTFRVHVQPELMILDEKRNKDGIVPKEALTQDRNQDEFPKYLKKLKEEKKTNLNVKKVNELKKITFNLDHSYMEIVQRNSNSVNLIKRNQEKDETPKSDLHSSSTSE